jgi:hypothetical protein
MPVFRVYAATYGQCHIDVEATDKDEANDIAREIDGGDWESDYAADDWEQQDDATHAL